MRCQTHCSGSRARASSGGSQQASSMCSLGALQGPQPPATRRIADMCCIGAHHVDEGALHPHSRGHGHLQGARQAQVTQLGPPLVGQPICEQDVPRPACMHASKLATALECTDGACLAGPEALAAQLCHSVAVAGRGHSCRCLAMLAPLQGCRWAAHLTSPWKMWLASR